MKTLNELTEREILALAIANEEEDSRIYQSFADRLSKSYPASAAIFTGMANEEREHRDFLFEAFRARFGENLPPIRREDVRGFLKRNQLWMKENATLAAMRAEAKSMEEQAAAFYEKTSQQTNDIGIRQLLTKLAEVERGHSQTADDLGTQNLSPQSLEEEKETEHQAFVQKYVQPGLVGLIDGSVSTLAPIFAAAFATHNNWETFLIGLAASIGAGISMGFAEGLSDDGTITGRGSPLMRGGICGIMTTIGGLFHTLPYLIPNTTPNAFWLATSLAAVIVIVELWAIAYIRARYMETPFWRAVFQVVLGGVLVFLTGILIGSA